MVIVLYQAAAEGKTIHAQAVIGRSTVEMDQLSPVIGSAHGKKQAQ